MRFSLPLDDRMMETVKVERGFPGLMTIQRVDEGDSPDLDWRAPRVVGKVRPKSLIVAGDIVEYEGYRYLCGTRGITPDYRSFWLFLVDRQVDWEIPTTVNDVLTGLPKSSGWSTPKKIWVGWEVVLRQPQDREINIQNEVTRIITNEPLSLNDRIGGQQVQRIMSGYGVTIAEVQ